MRWAGALVALGLAGPAAAQELTVVGLDGAARTFTAAQLAELPRASSPLAGKDPERLYEGPLLTYVLREAGVPAGARAHGDPMKAYVAVTGTNGYTAVLALAETDRDLQPGVVILADSAAGAPLPEREGPWRLVVGEDKKSWRAVYGVARIEVRYAD